MPITCQWRYILRGKLDVAALPWALQEIVRRHATLRTTFHVENGENQQVVAAEAQIPLPLRDLQTIPIADQPAEVERLFMEEAWRPFTLTQDLLVRVQLLRLAEVNTSCCRPFITLPPMAGRWGFLCANWQRSYRAAVNRQPSPLPELSIQYADFALWQRQRLPMRRLRETVGLLEKAIGWRTTVAHLTDRLPVTLCQL